jgi:hypothetical protein
MPSPALSAARRQAEEALAYNVHNPIVLGQAVRALLAATEQRCEVHGYAPPRGCVCSCEPRPTFAATAPAPQPEAVEFIDIVFDGPPEHASGRFVEVEDSNGRSIRFGSWVKRADGYWALRFAPAPPAGDGAREAALALLEDYVGVEDMLPPETAAKVIRLRSALDGAPKPAGDGVREAIRSVCSICNATLAALDAAKGGR